MRDAHLRPQRQTVMAADEKHTICTQFSAISQPPELSGTRVQSAGGVSLDSGSTFRISGFDLLAKRILDLSLGSVVFVLAAPLMIAIWLAIHLTSKGRAIIVQERVGRGGKSFNFYKFRTMDVNSNDQEHRKYVKQWMKNHPHSSGNGSRIYKIADDDRITPVGRFLRRYSLDELPQILNVLKLEMSLVGPRPAMPYEIELYKKWHLERLQGVPGMTGLWQVMGRNCLSFDEMVKLDIEYLRNWSLRQDLKILARTVPAVLLGTGL